MTLPALRPQAAGVGVISSTAGRLSSGGEVGVGIAFGLILPILILIAYFYYAHRRRATTPYAARFLANNRDPLHQPLHLAGGMGGGMGGMGTGDFSQTNPLRAKISDGYAQNLLSPRSLGLGQFFNKVTGPVPPPAPPPPLANTLASPSSYYNAATTPASVALYSSPSSPQSEDHTVSRVSVIASSADNAAAAASLASLTPGGPLISDTGAAARLWANIRAGGVAGASTVGSFASPSATFSPAQRQGGLLGQRVPGSALPYSSTGAAAAAAGANANFQGMIVNPLSSRFSNTTGGVTPRTNPLANNPLVNFASPLPAAAVVVTQPDAATAQQIALLRQSFANASRTSPPGGGGLIVRGPTPTPMAAQAILTSTPPPDFPSTSLASPLGSFFTNENPLNRGRK